MINVWACHQPDGQTAAPIDRWSSNITAAGIDIGNSCASGGAGYLEVLVEAVPHPGHTTGTWKFTAPSGTTVTGFSYLRSGAVTGWSDIAGFRSDVGTFDAPNLGDHCGPPDACRSIPWSWTGWTLPNTPGALLMLESCALDGGCDGNSNGWYAISSARVTLEDDSAPTFSTLTGAIASGTALRGNASLNFQLADLGVGLYRLRADVDGTSFDDRILNTNGGKCQPIAGTARDFIYAVPCPLNLSATTSLNTATLRDGSHAIDVQAEDAAGNTTTVFHGDVTTRNGIGIRRPRITLAITPTHTLNKHTIHWKGRVISDTLPRHGVTLLAQVKQGKRWIVFGQIKTDAKGRFKFHYRFHATTITTAYTFRVSLAEGGHSLLRHANSKPVKVHVKP